MLSQVILFNVFHICVSGAFMIPGFCSQNNFSTWHFDQTGRYSNAGIILMLCICWLLDVLISSFQFLLLMMIRIQKLNYSTAAKVAWSGFCSVLGCSVANPKWCSYFWMGSALFLYFFEVVFQHSVFILSSNTNLRRNCGGEREWIQDKYGVL